MFLYCDCSVISKHYSAENTQLVFKPGSLRHHGDLKSILFGGDPQNSEDDGVVDPPSFAGGSGLIGLLKNPMDLMRPLENQEKDVFETLLAAAGITHEELKLAAEARQKYMQKEGSERSSK